MAQAAYSSNVDALLAAMKAGIENGVGTAVEKVAAKARQLCPVGSRESDGPGFKYETIASNRERRKAGTKWQLNEKGRRLRGKALFKGGWIARKPGTLRDSIFTRIRWKDGTCLGWVKAGADGTPDGSAFYAPFVELGTSKMQAKPFMRPALRGVDLTDIGMAIGLEIGQTTRRGVKRRVYGV